MMYGDGRQVMAKAHMAFGQTIIYKTLHRKLKIEKHGPHSKPAVNSGAMEG